MKRILIFSFLCTILFFACARSEKKTGRNGGSFAAVSSTLISSSAVTEERETELKKKRYKKRKPWTITDMTGRKKVINLGEVNTKDSMIPMGNFDLAAEYSQVVGNHYYFLDRKSVV